jgi:hypothetical protein
MNGKYAFNGNLILEPYRKTKELKTTQAATGFSMVSNKVGAEPLELLVDTIVPMGNNMDRLIPKGSKISFKEHTLFTQKWPREISEADEFEGGFVVGHIKDALFIEEADE